MCWGDALPYAHMHACVRPAPSPLCTILRFQTHQYGNRPTHTHTPVTNIGAVPAVRAIPRRRGRPPRRAVPEILLVVCSRVIEQQSGQSCRKATRACVSCAQDQDGVGCVCVGCKARRNKRALTLIGLCRWCLPLRSGDVTTTFQWLLMNALSVRARDLAGLPFHTHACPYTLLP